MKKTMLCFAGMLVLSCSAAENVFLSTFEKQRLEQQWTDLSQYQKEKRLSADGGGMILDALPRKEEENRFCGFSPRMEQIPAGQYAVTFSSEFLDAEGDAHYGIIINGIQIVIRHNVWGFGKNISRINIVNPFRSGKEKKTIQYKVINTKTKIMVFADESYILEILKTNPGKDAIRFYLYNTKVKFSSASVEKGQENLSQNIVRNSSFETISGTLPEYWGSAWWGLVNPAWVCRLEEFRKHWGVDANIAYEGKNSFFISLPEESEGPEHASAFALNSTYLYLQKGKKYTVSAYMKSDRDSLPVNFQMRRGDQKRSFPVSGNWKRYSFTYQEKNGNNQLWIVPEKAGKIWIDAVQIEEGTEMTPYQKYPGETAKIRRERPLVSAPMIQDTPPVLDGILNDSVWKNAKPIGLEHRIDGLAVREKTNFMLACDHDNLYLAVECFDSRIGDVVANVKKHKGPVWEDDAVEIFLKPSPQGNTYYQFVVNTIGTKYEGRTYADSVWLAEWDTAVKKYADRWILEARIPFSNITMPADNILGFNIGRDNPKCREHSSWSKLNSFLSFSQFGALVLEKPKAKNTVRVDKAFFTKKANRENICDLEVHLTNSGNSDISCEIAMTAPVQGKIRTTLHKGRNTAVFKNLALPSDRDVTVKLHGTLNGKTIFSDMRETAVPFLMSMLREYSYFSNEKQLNFKLFFNGKKEQGQILSYTLRHDGKILEKGKITEIQKENKISLRNQYEPGDYTLSAAISASDGTTLASASDTFKILRPEQYESKVNYWKKTIVSGGKDFYIWGICLEMRVLDEALVKMLRDSGFNMLEFSGWYPDNTAFPRENILKSYDLCHKYGLKAVNSFMPCTASKRGTKIDGLIAFRKQIGSHPAQLLAYTFDEQSFAGFTKENYDFVDSEHAKLHREIGYNMAVFQNEYDLGIMKNFNFRNADVVSLDHYPVPSRDIASTAVVLKRLKKIAGNRPINLFTQIMGNAYFTPRLPTEQEIINQYYQGMALDCWNFIAFANIPLEPYFFPVLKKLRAEYDLLLKMGVNLGKDLDIPADSAEILHLSRKTEEGSVIIAVNLSREEKKCTFSAVPGHRIDVLFEKRAVQLEKDRTFSDVFAPLQRHVYLIRE